MACKIIQLSDLHIFHAPDQTMLGLDTRKSFKDVLHQALLNDGDADLMILTGDLIADNSPETYPILNGLLSEIHLPLYWIPGNHDHPIVSHRGTLNAPNICHEKVICTDGWKIILLNTSNFKDNAGLLDESQLQLLRDELACCPPELAVMIAMHHPPITLGSRWLDKISLLNANDFWNIIRSHDQVKVVVCGHVHQESCQQHEGRCVLTCPSTSIQFAPHTNTLCTDSTEPGYRTLTLHADQSFTTEVKRLDDDDLFIGSEPIDMPDWRTPPPPRY